MKLLHVLQLRGKSKAGRACVLLQRNHGKWQERDLPEPSADVAAASLELLSQFSENLNNHHLLLLRGFSLAWIKNDRGLFPVLQRPTGSILTQTQTCFPPTEPLPCQQQRQTAGPEIHRGPADQHHLLQDEGTFFYWSRSVQLNLIVKSSLCAVFRSRNCSLHPEPARWCGTASRPASTPHTTTSSTTARSCTADSTSPLTRWVRHTLILKC